MQTTIRSSFGLFLVVSMTALITVPAGSALPPGPEDEQGPYVAYAVMPGVMVWNGDDETIPDVGTLAFLDCEGTCDIVIWTGAVVTEYVCDNGSGDMLSVAGEFVLDWQSSGPCSGSVLALTNPAAVCRGSLSTHLGNGFGVGACVDT